MKRTNQPVKQAFDEYIGSYTEVTSEDKERFYKWLEGAEEEKSSKKMFILPKVATVFLMLMVVVIISSYINMDQGGSENVTKVEQKEKRVSFQKVSAVVADIQTSFSYNMTKEEAARQFGEGVSYMGQESYLEETEYHRLGDYKELERIEINEDTFLSGDVGVVLVITWDQNQAASADVLYLDKDENIATLSYKSNGMVYENGEFVENRLYPLDASTLLVKSIADSIQVDPASVNVEKLANIQDLTLQKSKSNGFEELTSKDLEVIRSMGQLRSLTLKGVALPIDTILTLESLETLVISNAFITDGSVAKLAEMPNLEKVTLDKDMVIGWKELKEEGIEVENLSKGNGK
ncbi:MULTISPECIES: hypothetical protein [Pontibacillus]|uniref:Uncharacterized protein n=1 Tax=Pontibacillus chungwhensis TaxID=265426 RepID=A0ABY8V3E6_9BACI|nr:MULTISPECIES: hypothetical protein [Pontibacillus]MCD5324342.1 hypothetical protein [Pontibacillus sp. HN14]WIF99359.1 hypothetical protein QNI29_06795 [Pontibacillus chungwhensis]